MGNMGLIFKSRFVCVKEDEIKTNIKQGANNAKKVPLKLCNYGRFNADTSQKLVAFC